MLCFGPTEFNCGCQFEYGGNMENLSVATPEKNFSSSPRTQNLPIILQVFHSSLWVQWPCDTLMIPVLGTPIHPLAFIHFFFLSLLGSSLSLEEGDIDDLFCCYVSLAAVVIIT